MSDEYEQFPVANREGGLPDQDESVVPEPRVAEPQESEPHESEPSGEPIFDPDATSFFQEPVVDELPPPAVEAEPQAEAEDPFAAWPQPESQTLVEEPLAEGATVEHSSGEIDVPDGYTVLEGTPTGHRRAVALVVSRYNGGVTNRMLARAIEALEEAGVASSAVTVVRRRCPERSSFPLAAMALAKTRGVMPASSRSA